MRSDDRAPLISSQGVIKDAPVKDVSTPPPRTRVPSMEALTGARGLFAIYVVTYHFFGKILNERCAYNNFQVTFETVPFRPRSSPGDCVLTDSWP